MLENEESIVKLVREERYFLGCHWLQTKYVLLLAREKNRVPLLLARCKDGEPLGTWGAFEVSCRGT